MHAVLKTLALMAGVCVAGAARAQMPPDPPRASPESVGMSSARLARIGEVLKADVAAGKLPGAVIAIVGDGKLVMFEAYGYRDKAAGVAMTTDTIFNIASMTKPMTTVGALALQEQGKLLIDDQVQAYIPELANRKVATLSDDGATITGSVPANRPLTIRDLLTHTSGMIYGGRGTTAVHKLYPEGSVSVGATMSGAQFIRALADAPLLYQPGTVWDYGFGLDVTGLVLEKVQGKDLGTILGETVFAPLGMVDTGFRIPREKAARYAHALALDPATGKAQQVLPDATQKLGFDCGGGCAVSTAHDYMHFALMLLNGGSYGGHRVLSPMSVAYMTSNQLGPEVRNLIGNTDPTRAGYGFGLGLAVRTTPGVAHLYGSVGDFSWPGASGTNWWVDPKEKLAVVFMSHAPGPARLHYRALINALVYQAIGN
jgi:CubicO group peptidase (beta-lactamase class C family)